MVERHPDEFRAGLVEIEDRLARLVDRIDRLRPVYETPAVNDVNPTRSGLRYMTSAAIDSVFEFLRGSR